MTNLTPIDATLNFMECLEQKRSFRRMLQAGFWLAYNATVPDMKKRWMMPLVYPLALARHTTGSLLSGASVSATG